MAPTVDFRKVAGKKDFTGKARKFCRYVYLTDGVFCRQVTRFNATRDGRSSGNVAQTFQFALVPGKDPSREREQTGKIALHFRGVFHCSRVSFDDGTWRAPGQSVNGVFNRDHGHRCSGLQGGAANVWQ